MFYFYRNLAAEQGKIVIVYYGVSGHGMGLVDVMSVFEVKTLLRRAVVTDKDLLLSKTCKSYFGNIICKIIESIIRDTILEYMVRNSLFSNDQHGVVPQRDCMANLLLTIETLTSIMEDGGEIDIIYTDFAKAFDSTT